MRRSRFVRCAFSTIVVVTAAVIAQVGNVASAADGSATYRCWSFNVDGGGGRCLGGSPIILHPDGAYQESSVRGRYTVTGNEIIFSKSTVRGPGRIKDKTIVFNYESEGHRYTVTYLLASGTPPTAAASSGRAPSSDASTESAGKRLTVDLTIRFPASDKSLGWIDTVALIPEGQVPEVGAKYHKKTALVNRERSTISASFDPPHNEVQTGRVYDVWVISSGLDQRKVGQIDLTSVTQDVRLSIDGESRRRAPR